MNNNDYHNHLVSKGFKGSEDKFSKVMREFEAGTLKTGAGDKVTDRQQALAIALSESRKAYDAEQKKAVKPEPKKPEQNK